MEQNIGQKYDKIARWWHDNHNESNYGLPQIERAISYCKNRGFALDVGCGSGGRVTRKLLDEGFEVSGIDASATMIELAQSNHPSLDFEVADISSWQTDKQHDFIVAWDSIFHLPFAMHPPVISKLCSMLQKDGILIYTFGDAIGEIEGNWHDDTFYYSSIGINENLRIIMESNCECRHLELDQYPEKHVVIIVQKME